MSEEEGRQNTPRNLRTARPGSNTANHNLDEILRVDHAGEYGAVRIYEGQLAVLGKRKGSQQSVRLIRHMADQEYEHLDRFNKLLNEHNVRPTALTPIWHVAGFALGAATALLGEKSAMTCTAAVEEVIDQHYANQTQLIDDENQDLKQTIEEFREEEIAHRDTAITHGAHEVTGHRFLSNVIKAGCRVAIKLSEKI